MIVLTPTAAESPVGPKDSFGAVACRKPRREKLTWRDRGRGLATADRVLSIQ